MKFTGRNFAPTSPVGSSVHSWIWIIWMTHVHFRLKTWTFGSHLSVLIEKCSRLTEEKVIATNPSPSSLWALLLFMGDGSVSGIHFSRSSIPNCTLWWHICLIHARSDYKGKTVLRCLPLHLQRSVSGATIVKRFHQAENRSRRMSVFEFINLSWYMNGEVLHMLNFSAILDFGCRICRIACTQLHFRDH